MDRREGGCAAGDAAGVQEQGQNAGGDDRGWLGQARGGTGAALSPRKPLKERREPFEFILVKKTVFRNGV